MPANLNTRANIFVLIDEAHRTTGGDLGNYLMAGLPNAAFIGFTGTPVDKTAYGKGTFKTFGSDDDKGYLHKYSIAESIEDGTTLPLYYNLAPNEMLVQPGTDGEGVLVARRDRGDHRHRGAEQDPRPRGEPEELPQGRRARGEDRAVRRGALREERRAAGLQGVSRGVDREACAKYKEPLDKYLPPEYSEVVYTGNNNDTPELKKYHLDEKKEKQDPQGASPRRASSPRS